MSLTYSLRTPYVRHARCEAHFDQDAPGYTMDFARPVKDYLDAKSLGLHTKSSHMPWSDEIVPNHYKSTNAIKNYKTLEALKVEHEIDEKTSGIFTNMKSRKRAPFEDELKEPLHVDIKDREHVVERAQKRIEFLSQRQFEAQVKHDTSEIVKRISKLRLDTPELPREIERHVRNIYTKALPPPEEEHEAYEDGEHTHDLDDDATRRPVYNSYMNTIDDHRTTKLFNKVQTSLQGAKRLLRKLDGRVECDFYKCSLNDKCWVCRKVVRNNGNLHYFSPIRRHRY